VNWIDYFYVFISSAALLLSMMGLWLTAMIPWMDRWNKRFFLWYFFVFFLFCCTVLIEGILELSSVSGRTIYCILLLETLLLSVPLPMLTRYLLHCSGDDPRRSKLFRTVTGLWGAYFVILAVALFTEGFSQVSADNQHSRGPLYPLLVIPVLVIMLLNLAGTLRRREQFSRKIFLGFLIAILPMTVTLIVQLFIDVFPLLDISIVLSALSMYGFALSDQVERDRRNQQEIIRQQQEIAHERASIMVLRMRPHFIYNTLMCIYSLCNQDPQEARQVTKDFTEYLRKNFNAISSDTTIPFTAELEHTRAYLAVEQAQHKNMLLVEYDTPFTRFRLPPLTLQPLVENAVKHGMDPYAGPLHIFVRTRHTDTGTEITVEDDGTGFDPDDRSTPHTTLENIRQRLEMMCGGSLAIRSRDGGGTSVTITIPDSTVQ